MTNINFRNIVLAWFILFLAMIGNVNAQRHSSYHSSSTHRYHSTSSYHPYHYTTGGHKSNYAYGVSRDSHGRIKRSSKERYDFMKQTGYSHGRKGYIIDHIIPLSEGGCDCPSNMQWQTIDEAKRKDKNMMTAPPANAVANFHLDHWFPEGGNTRNATKSGTE